MATCRELGLPGMMPSYTKTGKPWRRNEHSAVCVSCGTRLAPGEGIVGSRDKETGRYRWICGPIEQRPR